MKLFGVEVPAGDNAKRLMQRAYLKYSTISSIKSTDGIPVRAKWQDQISNEHKVHQEIMAKLAEGERTEGIENDPLENKDPDY